MAWKTRVAPLLLLAVCPSVSWAMGLGEIDLKSALNQPMRAEISIIGASGDELGGLDVHLASQGAFDRLGLDKPEFLSALKFEVTRNSAGLPVLKVTSAQPMTEPFVTFLLEAKWARGSLLREYTVLLDPPTFVPAATTDAPAPVVSPAQPARTMPRTSGTVLRQPEPAPATQSPPKLRTTAPTGAPYTPPAGSHRVGRGETLWAVAEHYRPDGVTLNQMMIALYDANPKAFSGNINRLRAGSILRMPSAEQMNALDASAADMAVREHMQSWHPGSGMVGPKIEPSLRLVPPSEPVSRGAAGESAKSAGTADTGTADDAADLRDEVDRLRRELDTAEDRLQVQSDQMATLQQNLDQARKQAEQSAAQAGPATQVQTPTPTVEPGTQAPAAQQQAETSPGVKKVVSAPRKKSMLENLLGWLVSPIAFVILGALALIAALLVFLRLRNKRPATSDTPWEDLEELEDTGLGEAEAAATINETASIPVSVSTGESARERKGQPGFLVEEGTDYSDTASLEADVFESAGRGTGLDTTTVQPGEAAASLDDTLEMEKVGHGEDAEIADPVAEADFHMAYGLYDQAAEILQAATQRDPSNRELQMKLAEVFFVWGNQDGFREVAQTLSADGEAMADGNWEKILIMGKQLLPDDEMFGEVPETRGGTDMDFSLEDSQLHEALDMELSDGEQDSGDTQMLDMDFGGAMDFEGDTQETPSLDVGDEITQEIPFAGLDSRDDSGDTVETPTQEAERTAEIDLDDLGLDVSLDDSFVGKLPDDYPSHASETAVMERDDGESDEETMISRPENTVEMTALAEQFELPDDGDIDFDLGGEMDETGTPGDVKSTMTDTQTLSADELNDDFLAATTEMPAMPAGGPEGDSTAEIPILDTDESIDLDLGTLTGTIDSGDTVEESGPDLDAWDVGEDEDGDEAGPTKIMDSSDMTMPESEALTLSEIGTKLDLARAYMDMGDPEGARNILEEVIEEGDEAQIVDARRLLDKLP